MANLDKLTLPNGVTYNVQDTVSGYVSTEATTSAKGLMSASDKTKLNGIASGAEVNQNAFSNIKVGSTTVVADAKTDTLEFVAGDNVILTPDATNDKITISSELPPTTKSVDNLPQPIASFSDGADAPLKELNVAITPQQDLHGYDSPWVGGAGKNKLVTDISWIKSNNTGGTWSGNSYSHRNVVIDILTDAANNIVGVKAVGTANYLHVFKIGLIQGTGVNYVLNGCPPNGSNYTYQLQIYNVTDAQYFADGDYGNGFTFLAESGKTYRVDLVMRQNVVAPSNNFLPMVRLEQGTDSSYEPYSNICPISGWDEVNVSDVGKNLCEGIISNANIESNGTISSAPDFSIAYGKVKKGETYTITTNEINGFVGGFFTNIPVSGSVSYNGQRIVENDKTFTSPIDGYVAFRVSSKYGSYNAQLELGSTATTYEPYNPQSQTIQVSWQTEAGEVYGGTLDVVNGVLTVTHAGVDLGTLTWIKDSFANNSRYVAQRNGIKSNSTIISDIFKPATYSEVYFHRVDEAIATHDTYAQIVIHSSTFEAEYDADGFKTQMNGHYAVYELATPITYQLTPTAVKSLLGSNNVWASTGDINDVVYLTQPYTGITANLAGYAYESSKASIADTASSVAWTNVTEKPSTYTPASHTHGNIQNGGTLQTNDVTIASGDKLVVTDSSDSNKVARTSVSFDGSTATKCLTQKGTWESFSNNTGTVTQVKVGTTAYNPSSGVVSLPTYPTTLPASNTTSTYSATGTAPVNGTAVAAALKTLPEPMVFKGTLGTGGTVTALPTNGTASVGDTYKVITAGTYASKSAKVGDTFICLTKTSSANTWELIPSGDEPSGTVTNVAVSNGGGLSVSGSPITSSGTITISHADTSSQASVNNSGRTYIQDITLDTYGHVTGIASATETVTNTDRYVNSAAFADATSADANNPVKMTLTRAGSDTASVTAYLPKVSSSSAGVAPKGTAVSSQSQSTKFLREDGTWAKPSYTTNTDTKNTAGSTDTSSKIFLIGATSQAANPQTYSQDTAYVGTDGCLYSGGTKVLTSHQDISGKADKSATVSTVTWDSTNKKLTKTINGSTTDVVTGATILGGLTKSQVTTALGYTPPTTDTDEKVTQTISSANQPHPILMSYSDTSDTTASVNNSVYRNNKVAIFPEWNGIGASEYMAAEDINNVGPSTLYGRVTHNAIGLFAAGFYVCGIVTDENDANCDITNYYTWDGTNASLKDTIAAIYDYIDDQITNALNTQY